MPRLTDGLEQIFSSLGIVGSGYKLYFYETGTTTPKTTYSDEALTTPNTNPVVLNAAGRPDTDIWGADTSTYRMILGTPDSTSVSVLVSPVKDVDPVNNFNVDNIAGLIPIPTAYWGTTLGTSSNYTLNPALVDITSYDNTQTFFIDFHIACADDPDIDINGLGALDLKRYASNCSKLSIKSGEIQVGRYLCFNDGTDIIILSSIPATTTNQGISYLPNKITVSNGTDSDHDIDFSGGVFNFDDGSGQTIATALTKQIDAAWVVGDNQGGLDTGTVAADTTYYMFAIYNPTTDVSDYLFSTSVDSPTLPSGYTKQKRIAALRTNGSSNIRTGKYYFNPDGSYRFQYASNLTDVSVNTITTGSRTLYPLTVPPSFMAVFTFQGFTETGAAGTKSIYITDPNQAETTTPTFRWVQGANENESVVAYLECGTDSSSQIGIRGNDSDPDIDIYTRGWIDYNL